MTDLWTEASAPIEAEEAALRMASSKVAVAGLWPFLALSLSEGEFEHRLSLAHEHIASAVPFDLISEVKYSLREDFRALAAKDAEGAEDADDEDGDGKPDWLERKIRGKESAYYHAGLGEWVAIGYRSFDPSAPSKAEARAEDDEAKPRSTEDPDEDADEEASWRDLGRRGPSEAARTASYWHAGQQRWVTTAAELPGQKLPDDRYNVHGTDHFPGEYNSQDMKPLGPGEINGHGHWPYAPEAGTGPGNVKRQIVDFDPHNVKTLYRGESPIYSLNSRYHMAVQDDQPGGGNPYYFTGGPEAGPNTGQTNQFPPHPLGADPIDPIQQMFPMQPSPWVVPPGGEWKEQPMNFNPPGGGYHPYGQQRTSAQVGDRDRCEDCGLPTRFVQGDGQRWWSHTGPNGAAADDDHLPYPPTKVDRNHPRSDSIHHRYTNPVNGARHLGEGAAGMGKNPNYFAGGDEGVAGEQSDSFPEDMAKGVDPDDRVNEFYDHMNPQPETDYGAHVARQRTAATPDNPAPDSDLLQGTQFDSTQERQRWETAKNPDAQQGSRDSSPATASRRPQFFDPSDPTVRVVAAGGFAPEDNPFTPGQQGGPGGDTNPFGGGGMGSQMTMAVPQTTVPRQMPNGGGGMAPDFDDEASGDPTSKESMRRRADVRERPTAENPYGTDDPFDATTWENASRQRPMLGPEHMNFNGPQNPGARDPIRTTDRARGGVRDEEREASLIATRAIRELVGR